MSETLHTESETMPARQIKARAAAWLERRHFWDWSAEDQAALDAWRAESSAHEVAYLRMEAAWSRTERLAALRPSENENAIPSRHLSRIVSRAVAGMAMAIVLGVACAYYILRPSEKVYATALGGHQTVRLADGTSIEINTDTVLRVQIGARERLVSLDRGEAYFQIMHDPARPFVVTAGNQRVTDIGTKFLVRRRTDRLEVAVVEGRVKLGADDGRVQRMLTQGEVALATENAVSVTEKPVQKLANELGWRHGALVFDHTTLADAANEINRYNRTKVIVADAAVGRLTIDGTFPISNTGAFIDAAQEVFGLRVEKRGDETVISR